MELWVMYLDGVPSGCALGRNGDEVVLQMRAATLGQKVENAPVLTVKAWKSAPINDCIRAGLGTLVTMATVAHGMPMGAQPGPRLQQ